MRPARFFEDKEHVVMHLHRTRGQDGREKKTNS